MIKYDFHVEIELIKFKLLDLKEAELVYNIKDKSHPGEYLLNHTNKNLMFLRKIKAFVCSTTMILKTSEKLLRIEEIFKKNSG